MAPLVVVTGGLGHVGRAIRPFLRGGHRLRIVDRQPGPVVDGEELVVAELDKPGVADEVTRGADAVIHLAGNGNPRAGWEEVYAANVVTTARLLDAAAAPRIVLASSLHVLGEYNRPRFRPVGQDLVPRPCCPYGLSKVVVESLGRLHHERTGASVVSLRLGLTGWPVVEERYLGMWLSGRDAGALFAAALTAPVGFGAYTAVSANTRRHWDLAATTGALGYLPRDDSEPLAPGAGPPTEVLCRLFGADENPPERTRT